MTTTTAAELHEHLRTVHGQVRILPGEATDPSFLLALHRIVMEQNPDETGPVCAPFSHRSAEEAAAEQAEIDEIEGNAAAAASRARTTMCLCGDGPFTPAELDAHVRRMDLYKPNLHPQGLKIVGTNPAGPHGLAEEVAVDRAEDDYCERGTQGCSVRHTRDSECQTW
jgi:hypothetical protein